MRVRRLSFFVVKDTDDKTDGSNHQSAELEEKLPSHEHKYHLPPLEEGKQEKNDTSS